MQLPNLPSRPNWFDPQCRMSIQLRLTWVYQKLKDTHSAYIRWGWGGGAACPALLLANPRLLHHRTSPLDRRLPRPNPNQPSSHHTFATTSPRPTLRKIMELGPSLLATALVRRAGGDPNTITPWPPKYEWTKGKTPASAELAINAAHRLGAKVAALSMKR